MQNSLILSRSSSAVLAHAKDWALRLSAAKYSRVNLLLGQGGEPELALIGPRGCSL